MNKLPSTRVLLVFAVILLLVLFLTALLFLSNLSFSVWEQLQLKPLWVQWLYGLVFVLSSLLVGRVVWRLLLPARKKSKQAGNPVRQAKSINDIEQRLQSLQKNSENTEPAVKTKQTTKIEPDEQIWHKEFESSPELAAIKQELEVFSQRQEEGQIYIALYGDISSGKSSLIKAMIAQSDKGDNEDCDVETSVLGGTTRNIQHYHWPLSINAHEQDCILTDMPGLNEQFAELDLLSTEEALRAHLVIYLCDGDLTASQFKEVNRLLALSKPCIVALNKSDQYTEDERQIIIENIHRRFKASPAQPAVVNINAAGIREYIRLTPDGREERVQRPAKPEIEALIEQITGTLKDYGTTQLASLREQAVASMLNERLDNIDARFKYSQCQRLVNGYTKKAIVASLATISPGSDILVQGFLGIQMIKALCKVYGVSATDIDANKLLELIQSRMDKTLPLLLAIAGNGLKAFPGVGTVSGGLMHAVAYGMIFDTLGKSVARTLEVTGELSAQLISDVYKEQLSENIESRAKDFIRLVLRLRKDS